jgi:hypothetical protein
VPVKRRISKQHPFAITDCAVRLFDEMKTVRYDSDRWWDLQTELHHETNSKPWDWPCVEDPRRRNPEPNEEARALWQLLEQVSQARKLPI